MSVDYPSAIDMIISDPAWVFTDALLGVPNNELTIVLHKTACGNICSATDVANFFRNDTQGHKSVHFIVGRDGEVVQVVALKDGAGGNCCLETGHDPYWDESFHKYGNLNRCTISIEHEDWSSDNSQAMTTAQVAASFAVVEWLVAKYNLNPLSQIKGHNTLDPISRNRCPGPTYPFDSLIKGLTLVLPNAAMSQAARESWNSVFLAMRLIPPPMTTGIGQSWQQALFSGKFYGPPLTYEYSTVDWNGNAIIAQEFAHARCEWVNGQAKWYN